MRLICGLFQLDGTNAKEDLLRAMAAQMDVLDSRPALTVWREGPVALGMLDFSARGESPLALPETPSAVMAADVRLDEPAAFALELNCPASLGGDSLLLAALERFGPSALHRVLGDFVFASWNPATQRLVCARDAFGIRPFSYVHKPGKLFAFASLPKALYGAGVVPKQIDEDAVTRRLLHELRTDDSLIAGIFRLPAAHFIEVSRQGISLNRYWQLDRAAVGTAKCSPGAAARELRRLVDHAVACRLPREGQIGAHLSGGLDSSSIAVLAARLLRKDSRTLHAYSFLDRESNGIKLEDETEFVQAVLEQESDIDWTPIPPPVRWCVFDTPMDADNMAPLAADDPENQVCARAGQQGVQLILSGWGGDEASTFNGRGALAELFLHARWRTLAREIAALQRERQWSRLNIFRSEVLSYLCPPAFTSFVKQIGGKRAQATEFFPRSLSAEARRRLAASPGKTLSMAPDGRENRWRLITSPHIALRTEIWAQTGARHGLAFAFPLMDRRVVEFSLSLPSEFFLRGGFRRRPFRDAMADVLPAKVRLRHQKYQPFPNRAFNLAQSKDAFIAKLAAYERSPMMRRLFDLAYLRQLIETVPSPAAVRQELSGNSAPAPSAPLRAVAHVLATAAYLHQHGDP
jgi:asparagine synthase (glutamine-hydrolysing)